MQIKKTAAYALTLAVLLSTPLVQAQDDPCFAAFNQLRENYANSTVQLTLVGADRTAVVPYVLLHAGKHVGDFDVLQHLNGEIRGYALKGESGFDYNQDRALTGPLSWHPTLVWHRVFHKDKPLRSYSCILTGRTRLAGQRVTLLRLVPKDSMRYSYLIALDDVHKMPVELSLLTPEGTVSSRMTVLGVLPIEGDKAKFPFDNVTLDTFKTPENKVPSYVHTWPELTMPGEFELIDKGELKVNDVDSEFQTFSDGITTFRVYRSQRSQVLFPALNDGSLTVYRKAGINNEYSVVGELPLKLAEYVLQAVR